MIEGFNSNIGNNPCKDCTKRSATCHGECKAYLDWKKLNDANKKLIDKKKYLSRL